MFHASMMLGPRKIPSNKVTIRLFAYFPPLFPFHLRELNVTESRINLFEIIILNIKTQSWGGYKPGACRLMRRTLLHVLDRCFLPLLWVFKDLQTIIFLELPQHAGLWCELVALFFTSRFVSLITERRSLYFAYWRYTCRRYIGMLQKHGGGFIRCYNFNCAHPWNCEKVNGAMMINDDRTQWLNLLQFKEHLYPGD